MEGAQANPADALRAVTVPLVTPSGAEGTGFFVAPGVLLTCAHVITDRTAGIAEVVRSLDTEWIPATEFRVIPGTYRVNDPGSADVVLLQAQAQANATVAHVVLHPAAEPGDPLWAYGYPSGRYRSGDSAILTLAGPSRRTEGAELLKTVQGPIAPGYSGGPVLNRRTGAVCGVVRYRDTEHGDTARLVPVSSLFATYPGLEEVHRTASPGNRSWLEHLDDEQLASTGIRFPGPRLREYLEAASIADERHPHAELAGTEVSPPLWKVYLRQQTSRYNSTDADEIARVEADSLLQDYPGVQILGGPGAGKSSLIRHLTAELAKQWLRGEGGEFVPIPVPADALRMNGGLTEMLAKGVQSFDVDFDRGWLQQLFSAEPAPGARWLVLADGLDEIADPSDRGVVARLVRRHRSGTKFAFMLTTRPTSVDHHTVLSEHDRYPTFVIEPFARGQLGDFAKAWFEALAVPDPEAESVRFVARANEAELRELGTIPLIATMMCVLYAQEPGRKLPSNRVDLYRQFVDLLREKRLDRARKVLREWGGRSGAKAEQAVDELLEKALDVLRAWAHEHYRVAIEEFATGRPVPALVEVASREVPRPDSVSPPVWTKIVHEVLLSTSLLISRRGGVEFLHQTILEFLAAEHLAQRRARPRRYLRPRSQRWKNWEVELFLVGLQSEDHDMTGVLLRLLRGRYWEHNHGFVVDLVRQGLPVPDKVRERLRQGLAEHLDHPQNLAGWREAATALAHVDAGMAVETLETILRDPRERAERFEALRLLLGLDRTRGTTAANYLIFTDGAERADRLRAAKIVVEFDPAHGLRALARLAAAPELRELRYEAAQLVLAEDRALGLETLRRVVQDLGCPERTRLAAAETSCAHDPDQVDVTLAMLSRDERVGFGTRLDAAVSARRHRPSLSADLLAELAEDLHLTTQARRRAARALGDTDRRAIAILREIASTPREDPYERVEAGRQLAEVELEAGLEVLFTLAEDARLETGQVDAAKAAGRYPEARGRALDRLTELTVATGVPFEVRRVAACASYDLDSERGVAVLTELATRSDRPEDRLAAASDLADGRARERGAALLESIVMARAEPLSVREQARSRLLALWPGLDRKIHSALARDKSSPIGRRADFAALLARRYPTEGAELIREIAASAPGRQALDVVARLETLDSSLAADEYRRVASRSGLDRLVRLRAVNRAARLTPPKPIAQSSSSGDPRKAALKANADEEETESAEEDISRLSKKRQLRIRVEQAENKKLKPEERLAAAEAAAKLNPGRAKTLMQGLLDERKTPKAVRAKTEKAIKRLR